VDDFYIRVFKIMKSINIDLSRLLSTDYITLLDNLLIIIEKLLDLRILLFDSS